MVEIGVVAENLISLRRSVTEFNFHGQKLQLILAVAPF